ncbi:MAG TPA: 16S rRNA (cytidine(1402)-2'-O)-methyltransferase [Acidobacteriaceae bacterium]
MAPGLYLVATPIGNLEDITLRALRVLQSVDRIACEDTRQTQKLLNHFGIKKPTVSYHLHNENERAGDLLEQLQAGGRIAIVSDAGTPGIADPGGRVVQAAIAAGVQVFPVPGANAAVSALIASGLPAESFVFHGFLPSKAGPRKTFLEALGKIKTEADPSAALRDDKQVIPTHIFYEAPHRILETLSDVEAVFGASHAVVVARELTKLHEEFLRGSVAEVRAKLAARDVVRGEIVLLLSGEFAAEKAEGSLAEAMRALLKDGLSEKDALKRVARDRGLSKSDAYREWQRVR